MPEGAGVDQDEKAPAAHFGDTACARHEAHVRAFRLIHDLQAELPGAVDELRELADHAEAQGWDEVIRACVYGEAVRAWFTRDGDAAIAINELIERSDKERDPVMLALGLALRCNQAFVGVQNPALAAAREADLARAVVLLEEAEGGPLERISAYTAIGIAFQDRWLFELSDAQYLAGLEVGRAEPPGSVDFLLSPIMFNLAEAHVCLAAMLRQIGDEEGVAQRWRSWNALLEGTHTFDMAASWQLELSGLGLVLGAIAGEDVSAQAARLLARLDLNEAGDLRTAGLLKLATALNDVAANRPQAPATTEAAIAALDAEVQPHVYDLALYVAAELEAREGAFAGLRCARRQVEQKWATRIGALAAAQARIQAERLTAEREVLTRHARMDDLTGVGNRRAFSQHLLELQRQNVGTIALIVLDVDGFKSINDGHGHLVGDAVLVHLGRVLEHGVRSSDLAVRLGGDEFAVVLADADLETGFERARAFLSVMHERSFDDVSPGLKVALSAGVAAGDPACIEDLRAEADAALYRAKALGGRRVVAVDDKGVHSS